MENVRIFKLGIYKPQTQSLEVKRNNTFSKTLQNVETIFWVKSDVYVSPTFFTMESMRYNTGNLISARTYRNNTNILGGGSCVLRLQLPSSVNIH
jgi:hypothetical protein